MTTITSPQPGDSDPSYWDHLRKLDECDSRDQQDHFECREEIPVFIRWMHRCDMPAVFAIENRSFHEPWTESEFHEYRRRENCVGLIAEHNGQIVGYAIYVLEATQISLANLAVDPDFRLHGIGRQIVEKLKLKMKKQTRTKIVAVMPENVAGSQIFLRQTGFTCVATLTPSDAEPDDAKDAYVFVHGDCVATRCKSKEVADKREQLKEMLLARGRGF